MNNFFQIRDLLIAHPGSNDLKICDFGLARRIEDTLAPLEFGQPEFVAPEVVNGEGVGLGQGEINNLYFKIKINV